MRLKTGASLPNYVTLSADGAKLSCCSIGLEEGATWITDVEFFDSLGSKKSTLR